MAGKSNVFLGRVNPLFMVVYGDGIWGGIVWIVKKWWKKGVRKWLFYKKLSWFGDKIDRDSGSALFTMVYGRVQLFDICGEE